MANNLQPPRDRRTLILAAHADDEIIGAFGWLTQCRGRVAIAYLTDGAPAARWRPPAWASRRAGSRAAYRRLRRTEAVRLWRSMPGAGLHFAAIADQRLMFHLRDAAAWLVRLARRQRPGLLLAPAFEGGHPDHDAANLLAAQLGRRLRVPVWEYALYTSWQGAIRRQCFPGEPHWGQTLAPATAAAKRAALGAYASQAATLAQFDPGREALRPLPVHDYRRPARAEPCVWELWGWPWPARAVAARFWQFLDAGACGY